MLLFYKGKIFYECETKLEETEEVNPQTERHAGVSSLNVFHRLETGAMSHLTGTQELAASESLCSGLV